MRKIFKILYFILATVFCAVLCINSIVDYNKLEKKIIPAEIYIPLDSSGIIEFVSNNFDETDYILQVAFKFPNII